MDIKILVATHKKYWMPDDDVYMPLHVGREGKQDLGYIGDNTGDNISSKNANYCELTGLYWAWKNLDCEYIGLCHYRRYFGRNDRFISYIREEKERIFKKTDYQELLRDYDILLPTKTFFRKTVGEHYALEHCEKDMNMVRKLIRRKCPNYIESFDSIINSTSLYSCNMFVAKKSIFDDYCEWLFSLLFDLEKMTDISTYDAYQSRVYGFLSERMFNVWLHKQNYKIKEIDVVMLEKKVKLKRRIGRRIYKFFRL